MVSTDPGLTQHLQQATQLINQSLSRNTLKAYHTAWDTFTNFLTRHSANTTPSVKHVLAFISYCHTCQSLSYNTIRLYLAGVQHFLTLHDPAKPSLFTSHAVKAALRAVQKQQPVVNAKRLPITSTIFRDLSAILATSRLASSLAWSYKRPST